MVRRSLELLSNKKQRQKAFLQRKSVLMKKARELSVLCDVKVGMMIFSPEDGDDHHTEQFIWPENSQDIQSLIDSYKKSGECFINNNRRNFDSSKVLNYQIQKAKNELAKLKQKNAESRRPGWDDRLNSLSSQELVQFSGVLENKIQEIRFRAADVTKQSCVTVDPLLFFEAQHMFESKSDVWQAMNLPDQYGGVEVPLYNTFDGAFIQHSTPEMTYCAPVEVPTEEVPAHDYGQALMQQHCAPMMSDYALAMQQLQPQVASYAPDTEKLWWQF